MNSEFRILGIVEVLQDGDSIDLGSPRQRALLARLLTDPGRPVSTERLLEDLWSGDPPPSGRHALHVYVSRLRKALGDDRDRLVSEASGYVLQVSPDELDASRFEQLTRRGRAARTRGDPQTASSLLHRALELWRGPALTEFAEDQFAREERTRLGQLRVAAVEERIWADLELGRHHELVEELQELSSRHPYREEFCEQLMLALYRSGRQGDALRAFQTTRARLAEDLGVEPGPALRRMEDRILAQDPLLDIGHREREAVMHLPVQRTSFVGRKRELEQAADLLGRSRLLTLTGPPGSGKTRLALRLASECGPSFQHGVFFLPLAAIADPSAVDREIARVLEVSQAPRESVLDGLKAFLRDRRSLLVLDNFEQILGAAPLISELIDTAPGVTFLVTSRAPLGLVGEQEFPVPPLDVPPPAALEDLDALAAYDAVALFIARSQAPDPDFALNRENAAAIAGIIARLDGLPLAIELAAARMRVLTPQDLLRRLERRLAVLASAAADTVDRQRTMRDAIAWSFDLLVSDQQALFRRLGVFVGGFTPEAASDVAGLPAENILDGMESLLSNSLVYRPVATGPARFAMLETLREFALEKLEEAGEGPDVSDQHAHYYLGMAREYEPQLQRDPTASALERLGVEVDNIREALRHALAGDPDLGLELASSVWRFWQSSNLLTEGREWLTALLAHSRAGGEARAHGLTALGGLAYWQADYDAAVSAYTNALDLYRQQGDRLREAETLYSLSLTANWKGDLDAGRQHAEAAQILFEEVGSPADVAKVMMAQAFVLWRHDEIEVARQLWEQSMEIARDSGDRVLANTQLVGLASLAFRQGKATEALRIILGAVEEAAELHNVHVIVWMLDFVAAFAAGTSPTAAVRLAGAVDSLRREAGGGIQPGALDIVDARTAAAEVLDQSAIDVAWGEGRVMTLEEAIDEAHRLEHLVGKT